MDNNTEKICLKKKKKEKIHERIREKSVQQRVIENKRKQWAKKRWNGYSNQVYQRWGGNSFWYWSLYWLW